MVVVVVVVGGEHEEMDLRQLEGGSCSTFSQGAVFVLIWCAVFFTAGAGLICDISV